MEINCKIWTLPPEKITICFNAPVVFPDFLHHFHAIHMDLPLGFCKTKYYVQDYVVQNNMSCNFHQKDTYLTVHQNSHFGILVQDNNNNFKSNFIDWLKNLTSKFSKSSSFLPYCISQTCHWYWNFDRLGSCCKTRCHVWTNARIKVMTDVSSLVKLQKTMKLKCIGQETTFHKISQLALCLKAVL